MDEVGMGRKEAEEVIWIGLGGYDMKHPELSLLCSRDFGKVPWKQCVVGLRMK